MEVVEQEEKQELECKNPNEDQGGIRRRLRDRDLLRKRRAEAEEKETNQEEIQRKGPRVQSGSGTKRRGRPRKTEATPEISALQQEPAAPQEPSSALVESGSPEAIPDPVLESLSSLAAVESQPASVLTAPAPLPVCDSVQSPISDSTLTPSAPVNPTSDLFSPSAPVPAPAKVLDTAPVPVQDLVPALAPAPDAVQVPTLNQAPVIVAPPVGSLYKESEGREAPNQVIIEDLGPDEEENSFLSQDKRADEDLNETPLINKPEQNKMLPVPHLSSLLPPQDFLP